MYGACRKNYTLSDRVIRYVTFEIVVSTKSSNRLCFLITLLDGIEFSKNPTRITATEQYLWKSIVLSVVLSQWLSVLSIHAHCCLVLDVILRATLLERMPVLDEATYSAKNEMGVDGQQTAAAVASESDANGHLKQPNGIGKQPAATANLMDLLSFTDEQPSTSSNSSGNALLDLLGNGPLDGSNSLTSSGKLRDTILIRYPIVHP